MKLYEGTSGFSYPKWKGSFYPDKLAQKNFLEYYSNQLAAVEINNTFYRMPKAELLEKWAETVPEEFRFVLKANRRISHFQRLVDCEDNVDYLVKMARALGQRRGPFLLQLPPNFKIAVERLKTFLEIWPPQERIAIEFRNPTWFEDEVFDVLRNAGAALCIAESGTDMDAPVVATADFGYLRLRREDYADGDVESWAQRVRKEMAAQWEDVYVFLKHEDAGAGPRLAKVFKDEFER